MELELKVTKSLREKMKKKSANKNRIATGNGMEKYGNAFSSMDKCTP